MSEFAEPGSTHLASEALPPKLHLEKIQKLSGMEILKSGTSHQASEVLISLHLERQITK